MNPPIITKVAWRLMPIGICYLFAYFDRINARFAELQLQDPLTFSDPTCGLGASLALLLSTGAILFLLLPAPQAKEEAA